MTSYNATTYTSAAQGFTDSLNSTEIKSVRGRKGIVCKFIPKKTRWVGDYWKYLIALRKMHQEDLRKGTYHFVDLTDNCCGNKSPVKRLAFNLCSDDISGFEPLAHILHSRRLTRLLHEEAIQE